METTVTNFKYFPRRITIVEPSEAYVKLPQLSKA